VEEITWREEVKIICPNRPVFADNFMYKPYCRYIVSDYEAAFLVHNTPNTEWTHSSFNSWERRYGGQDLNGKSVCLYRHTAFGDQLMMSSIPRYLKSKFPNACIHLYCDPGIIEMWKNNPFVGGSAIPIPIPFEVARSYDYHIFFEGMLENNGEHDQNCCYDDFFGVIGMPDVPDQFKRPHLIVHPRDYNFVREKKLDLDKPYLLYHLAPANKNRCYPVELAREFIIMFLEETMFEEWRVIVVGKEKDKEAVFGPLRGIRGLIDLVNEAQSFRDCIPIVEKANLMVCPDSAFLHLGACFPDVPMISLWGPFNPNDRAKYYVNNHPIFKPDVCPFAACRNHDFTLPIAKCVKARNWKDGDRYCAALKNIEPCDIMNLAEKILG